MIDALSRKPPWISRMPRATVVAVPFHAGLPDAASGRQRKHGRKPARSAGAPVAKKLDVLGFRGPHTADRTAIDARAVDAGKELPVIARVSHQTRPITFRKVE